MVLLTFDGLLILLFDCNVHVQALVLLQLMGFLWSLLGGALFFALTCLIMSSLNCESKDNTAVCMKTEGHWPS